jgi:hypothetical protein
MVKYYIGEAVVQVVLTSVMAVVAMEELEAAAGVQPIMFRVSAQD